MHISNISQIPNTTIDLISVARAYIFRQYEISENNCDSLEIVGEVFKYGLS